MYRSLGVITCHINHMEIPSQSYTLPNDLLKSGGTAATTDADDCVSQLKTADDLKTALFPAATANEDSDKACPTLQTYVNQIKAYGSLNLEEDVWTPSEANCNSVASHNIFTEGLTQVRYNAGNRNGFKYGQHCSGDWMAQYN